MIQVVPVIPFVGIRKAFLVVIVSNICRLCPCSTYLGIIVVDAKRRNNLHLQNICEINGSSILSRLDMKTKSVFVLLLTLLFCFGANLSKEAFGQCLCPDTVSAAQDRSTISNAAQDICDDCGHKTECCFSNTDMPIIGSFIQNQGSVLQLPIASSINGYVISCVCSAVLAQSCVNKAPLQCQPPTLFALHQQLLI